MKQTGAEIRDNGFTQDVYVAPYKGDRVCAISYHLIRTVGTCTEQYPIGGDKSKSTPASLDKWVESLVNSGR